jgi:branched-chain amino acid transport system substrate-binding protein
MKMRTKIATLALLVLQAMVVDASAQVSDGVVKIGVMNDQSGPYADLAGPGSVIAAQMAVEDFGGTVLGKPIEVISANHLNKADVGVNIARQWFDTGKVDLVVDIVNSSVALGVQQLAREKNRVVIVTAVGTDDFTGKSCTPTSISWLYDSYALANSLVQSAVKSGLDSWYFITVDYAFGQSMQADATRAIANAGGKVLGSVRHPINTSDFSSYLLQAQASGAKVVAFANGGADLINSLKQAREFGLASRGQTIVTPLMFITDVKSLGLEAAQELRFVTAFYWDRNDETRQWSRRFFERHKAMPTMVQASVYSAVRHYLAAVRDAKTDEAQAVVARMRATPVNDFYVKNGQIRADGRLVHDMYLVEVKKPEESHGPWDLYKIIRTVPGAQAFRPAEESGCPLVKKSYAPEEELQ